MAAKNIGLVAMDLDGTLLRSDGTVSTYTRDVLRRCAELVPIVLVTARPPRTARRIARVVGVEGPLVCCNGALVYDTLKDAVVAHRPIAPADAAALIRTLRGALPDVRFAFELETTYAWEPGYRELMRGDLPEAEVLAGDALDLCSRPVTKLIVRHPLHGAAELVAKLDDHVRGGGFTTTYSTGDFLEISAEGVDKASAVAAICRERGVDRTQVVAFGDMRNDLPMLLWAGRPIAVANAHPDVLAAVPERTASNDDDGVARALASLVLSR